MHTEIEAKFPDIDIADLRQKLRSSGAVLAYPERLMRRRTFDLPDRSLYAKGGWVRVRDEGDKITLSYKQLDDRTFQGTKEATVTVGDYDAACAVLRAIGMVQKSDQETKRELWKLGDVEITIDTWPWAPSFAELEGPDEEAVKRVAAALGFDWSRAMHGSVETIYQMSYDATDEEIDSWPSITFVPVPEWLLAKKKRL